MELNGAHVLVTGASRGIGAALARAYAKEGAKVSLVARNTDAIKALADELNGHAFTCDLLDPDQVDELISRVEHEVGPIDVLVNNAGLETSEPFQTVGSETIRDVVRLNLEAPIVLTRNVLPGMLDRGKGHLVYLSSLAGTGGFPGLAVYAGTKAGVSNFVASLRMEMRDTPITTTVVAPGPVDTEMWDHIEEANDYAPMLKRLRLLQLIPKKSPETIAKRTVAATVAERRHVRTPRRLFVNHAVREVPTRITELVLSGVPLGPKVEPRGVIETTATTDSNG